MKLETDKVLTPAETRVAAGYVSGMIGKEIASAAGHQLPVWEASYTTHYFNNPGTGASSFRFL